MEQHNHSLPSHNHSNCSYQTGPGGGHTHSIQEDRNQLSVLLNHNDFALFFRYDRKRVYLASGKLCNTCIPSEIPLDINETINYLTEMLSRVIVGCDINMFIEGVKQELIDVINLKLKELDLVK